MNEATISGRAVDVGQGWTWIVDGFGLFRKNPGIWIALILVLGVILIVLSVIPVIGAVATLLLLPVFSGGLMLGCHALQRDGALEMGHLFAGFKTQTRSLIVLGALSLAAWVIVVFPAVLIVGGGAFFGAMRGDLAGVGAIGASFMLALLVALGLSILVYMALWFAPALVVLRGVAPIEAIKQSFIGCLKNIVPFLIYGIAMLVLGVLATIPLALGWLVLGPVLVASIFVAFRDIYGDA